MKKLFNFLIFITLFISLILLIFKFISNHKSPNIIISDSEKENLIIYLNDIYNSIYGIPEFNNINEADETWLWDNINQYLTNHSEFEERNLNCSYTYEEISSYAKILYGDSLNKKFPIGNEVMIYDEENNLFGVPSSYFNNFFEYQIENIQKNNNIYTVNIIDYAISFWEHQGEHPTYNTNFFNINEFNLNGELSKDIIFYVTDLKEYENNILKNKDKFTSKTLTIEYDTNTQKYHIKSCKYNYSDKDIIKDAYFKMLNSFNLYYLKYNSLDFETSDIAEITNINNITSIYTENGLEIYKNLNNKLLYENENAFINYTTLQTTDNLDLTYNVFSTEISNINKTENEITCTITNKLLKNSYYTNYPPSEEDFISEPFNATFKLIKINDVWKIEEFNITFNK